MKVSVVYSLIDPFAVFRLTSKVDKNHVMNSKLRLKRPKDHGRNYMNIRLPPVNQFLGYFVLLSLFEGECFDP